MTGVGRWVLWLNILLMDGAHVFFLALGVKHSLQLARESNTDETAERSVCTPPGYPTSTWESPHMFPSNCIDLAELWSSIDERMPDLPNYQLTTFVGTNETHYHWHIKCKLLISWKTKISCWFKIYYRRALPTGTASAGTAIIELSLSQWSIIVSTSHKRSYNNLSLWQWQLVD